MFQRQRVDMLLGELLRKFPPPVMNPQPAATATETPAPPPVASASQENNSNNKQNSETSDFKPPEKRAK